MADERCKCGQPLQAFLPCPNAKCQNGRVVVNNTFAGYEYAWCPDCKGWGYARSCLPDKCTKDYTLDYPANPPTEEIKWVRVDF